MRYAILSDIHGNLEAFQAALKAISKDRIDKYLSLGDIIGYGADPGLCIRLISELKPNIWIAGNHEWGALGLFGLENFNDLARDTIIWTRGILDADDMDFLKTFRLVYEAEEITLVHGSIDSPMEFNYILSDADAASDIKLLKTKIAFVGHSHVPGVFYSTGGRISYTRAPKVKMIEKAKYIVNAGSIGQPRDSDPRASYVIYDTASASIEIRRVEYDIAAAQKKILDAGLPDMLAFRLLQGR